MVFASVMDFSSYLSRPISEPTSYARRAWYRTIGSLPVHVRVPIDSRSCLSAWPKAENARVEFLAYSLFVGPDQKITKSEGRQMPGTGSAVTNSANSFMPVW